jgi:hypothetical protein
VAPEYRVNQAVHDKGQSRHSLRLQKRHLDFLPSHHGRTHQPDCFVFFVAVRRHLTVPPPAVIGYLHRCGRSTSRFLDEVLSPVFRPLIPATKPSVGIDCVRRSPIPPTRKPSPCRSRHLRRRGRASVRSRLTAVPPPSGSMVSACAAVLVRLDRPGLVSRLSVSGGYATCPNDR